MIKQPSLRFFKLIGRSGLIILLMSLVACGGTSSDENVEATIAAAVQATQQAGANVQATIDAAVAATLQANQSAAEPVATPPVSVSTSSPQADELEQVRTVILNEVSAAISQDLDLLQSLYAPEALVIDHGGTPDNPADDTVWQGWANIERRYLAFFSEGISSINLVDLAIQVDGDRAIGTHRGVVLDGTYFEDNGIYTLAKSDDRWRITGLEYGNKPRNVQTADAGEEAGQAVSQAATVETGESAQQPGRDDGLYILEVGNQHRYEEPWGWDRGNPCQAWETDNFDDTKPYYRGFNVELLLTNNSDEKIPDQWPINFTTAKGVSVPACYYAYAGSGPPPGATSSVTFFTVVEQGDYVEKITFNHKGQTVQLCLDGRGGWSRC